MPFRDDQLADRSRIAALEEQLETCRADNQRLPGARRKGSHVPLIALLIGLLLTTAAILVGVFVDYWEAEIIATILGALAGVAVITAVMTKQLHIVPPTEVLILSGRATLGPDGTRRGYRAFRGRRVFRLPFIEHAEWLDVRPETVDLLLRGVGLRGGGRADVHVRAVVRIAGREPRLHNAVERFLGRTRDEVIRLARETLEGIVHGVCAKIELEVLTEDRFRVAEEVEREVHYAFDCFGLELEQIQLLDISAK